MRYREYLSLGDWHVHSWFTDGTSTVSELCQEAITKGLKLLAVTEHVRRSLSYDFGAFLAEIQQARKEFPELVVLAGCEAKVVNLQGDLDVSDDVLQRCDLVMGVFHFFPFAHKEAYMQALCNMLRKDYVDLWGHPTLFAVRHGIALSQSDTRLLGDLCNSHEVLVERNLKYRVPNDDFIRDAGIRNWVWGSDAHSPRELLTLEDIRCAMF